ncbi:MAG: signal peptidase II [Rhodobacteraceae bacterium]|nr:signal peptidase II [Paracoccaceae bacterium]
MRQRVNSTRLIGLIAAFVALFIDQATKALIVANATTLGAVFHGFNLTLYRNDGVTFGLLGDAPWWGLAALALAVCAWLAVMMLRTRNRIDAIAYGSVIGGAFGNVVDRFRFQAVTDFLDFYIGPAHWPAFNMADVFIVSGVGLLLIAPIFQKRCVTEPMK